MKRLIALCALLLPSLAFGGVHIMQGDAITAKSLDATYGVKAATMQVTAAGLLNQPCLGTDSAGIFQAGACGGGTGGMTAGATFYIQQTNSLQSGATFYVSSGTVAGQLTAGTFKAGVTTIVGATSITGDVTLPGTGSPYKAVTITTPHGSIVSRTNSIISTYPPARTSVNGTYFVDWDYPSPPKVVLNSTGTLEFVPDETQSASNPDRVTFRSSETLSGSSHYIWPYSGGTPGQLLSVNHVRADGSMALGWGSLAAAGSSNQVQYNSGGSFAGASNFTFNGTTQTVTWINASSGTIGHLDLAGTSASDTNVLNLIAPASSEARVITFKKVGGADYGNLSTNGDGGLFLTGAGNLTLGAGASKEVKMSFSSVAATFGQYGMRLPNLSNPGMIATDASGTLYVNTTSYIQNTSTLQTGTTFYVSSGTVSGQLTVGTLQGASLSTCGDSTHALAWSGGSFSCQSITGTGGGGGASVMETMVNNVQVTSPTATQNIIGPGVSGTTTSSTATIRIDHILGYLAVTGNYTAVSTDTYISADASGGAITVTLPTAVGRAGKVYHVKAIALGANAVTVATTSAQTIDGQTTQVLNLQYTDLPVISDGANWSIL